MAGPRMVEQVEQEAILFHRKSQGRAKITTTPFSVPTASRLSSGDHARCDTPELVAIPARVSIFIPLPDDDAAILPR